MRTQENKEKYKEYDHKYYIKNRRPKTKIGQLELQIDQLKQQLIEKDKEIKKLNWQLKDKDFIIKNLNHSLSVAPNANAGQRARIDELTKIVKEKEKEINSLIVDYEKRISQEQELMSNMEHRLTEKQNEIDEINKEFVQSVKDWKTLCAEKDKEIEKLKQQYTILENENGKLITELIMDKYKKAQKEVSFGIQLAIQKLEEVKENLKQLEINIDNQAGFSQGYKLELKQKSLYKNVYKTIDQQIKELKGEKDVKD